MDESDVPSAPAAATFTAPRPWLADACLLVVACIWGANIPITKYATAFVDPFVFNASRLLFSVAVLGLGAHVESRNQIAVPVRGHWLRVVVFSLISGFVYQLFFLFGITRTSSGNAALILSSMPMWTAVFSFIFLRERLPISAWWGLLITFVGTVIVTVPGGQVSFSSGNLVGNLLMLAASLTWAGGTVMSRTLLVFIRPIRLAFIACSICTPLHCLVAATWFVDSLPAWSHPGVIASILFSGILSTGLAYVLWHVGVRRIGASHAAVYQNLVTLVAILGGWIILREMPNWAQIVGGMMIVAGLVVMRRGR